MVLRPQCTLQIFLASGLLLISCDVSTFAAPQQIPTPMPGVINLIVAQTAAAAATQTATLVSPTPTLTSTPLPIQTLIGTATPVPTFFFSLALTSALTPNSTAAGNGGGGSNGGSSSSGSGRGGHSAPQYSCHFITQSPKSGTTFTVGQSITGYWEVENVGRKTWVSLTTGIKFVRGTNYSTASFFTYTFSKPIVRGVKVILQLPPMTAPSQTGKYVSRWTLIVGKTTFCPLSMNLTVR